MRPGEVPKVVGDELLMGRFRVLERIGAGGMGTVYRAFDERLQRQVALKEIPSAEPARVLREAQAAARLNHPGIVTLYELGERDGHALLVSELVPGPTLSRLHQGGRLRDRDVAEIAADLSDALAHAHARGVIHRDVKPQNVIVRDDQGGGQRAKLMDFGIARIAGAPTLTAAGEVVGTLAYMSPEQADGSLAARVRRLLARDGVRVLVGENPAAAASPAQTCAADRPGNAALCAYRPDLPEPIAAAIDASLGPEPELRPTATELRDVLEAELGALDPDRPVPLPEGAEEPEPARRSAIGAARLAALACFATALVLLAGPLGAGGLALVLAALCLPALLVGAPAAALAPAVAPAGRGGRDRERLGRARRGRPHADRARSSAPAPGRGCWRARSRSASARTWGIAPPAPDGWVSDRAWPRMRSSPRCSARVVARRGCVRARCGGPRLGARRATRLDCPARSDGLGGGRRRRALRGRQRRARRQPLGVVGAAVAAVGIEFLVMRGREPVWHRPRRANGSQPLTT